MAVRLESIIICTTEKTRVESVAQKTKTGLTASAVTAVKLTVATASTDANSKTITTDSMQIM